MTDIYVLWHCRTDEQGCEHEKMLGIYTTRAKAEEGLALLRDKPGFKDYLDGFEILEGALDETYMLEGFITVQPGEY